MRDRILKLCKRHKQFTIEELELVSELDTEEITPYLNELLAESKLTKQGNTYFYNKKITTNRKISKLPLFFQFHSKQDITHIIRGFCADVEVLKMINLFGFSKHVMSNFYQYFRSVIYEEQKKELLEHFEKTPKMPQERVYMNTKVYLYLYNNKLFVSDKYLVSKDSRKHREDERLEIKNIYLRSYRKVLSRSFEHKFHLHLAEELWKYGKDFDNRYKELYMLFRLS